MTLQNPPRQVEIRCLFVRHTNQLPAIIISRIKAHIGFNDDVMVATVTDLHTTPAPDYPHSWHDQRLAISIDAVNLKFLAC